jgi:hypothetical protein
MAMMAITTSSSINDKPRGHRVFVRRDWGIGLAGASGIEG